MGAKLLIALAVAGLAPNSTYYSNGYPPERFEGNTMAVVQFVTDVNRPDLCGVPPPGMTFLGCTDRRTGVVTMFNPCEQQFEGEQFARIMCHEKGHLLGWPATHGD